MINHAFRVGEKVLLGSLVSQVRDTVMPEELPTETPFVGLEDIISNEGQLGSVSQVSSVKSRVFQFQSDDVLYGRLRPYLRKAVLVDFDGSASGEIIVLRCSERILPRYLLMLLLSEDFTRFVKKHAKGDRPRTSFAAISTYGLDLPPLEVQAEVCMRDTRLASAMSKLEDALAAYHRASLAFMNIVRSRLIWDERVDAALVPLADILKSIDYGTAQKSNYGGAGIPTLRIPNINPSGEIDTSDLKYALLDEGEFEKYRLIAGDLLLIRSNGSLSLVGRAAKVGKEQENYAFAGYLLRLRPADKVLSDFLLELVRSIPFQRMVETAARSSTGINNLSAGRLSAFVVPLPSLKYQEQVTDILVRLQQLSSSSSERLKQAWLGAKNLRDAARGLWLGHSVTARTKQSFRTSRKRQVPLENHIDERAMEMIEDIEVAILRRLDSMSSKSASFESLSEGMKAEYDVLRDAVFKLLSLDPPNLVQFFDEETRSIILRRPL